MGLAKLREHRFGSKMRDYRPPVDDDPFAENVPDLTLGEDLVRLYCKWKDLPKQTRKNLEVFEDPDFELPSCAEGVNQVAEIVSNPFQCVICSNLNCHLFSWGN
jgi:hypothetical protein